MLYLQLFLSFFKIGLFGFGGGLAIMSLIQMEVERYGWMSPQEFVDIVAVSQVTPGPIGINCATYVGYTATGSVWGAVLTTTAIVLPSLIIMLSICRAYFAKVLDGIGVNTETRNKVLAALKEELEFTGAADAVRYYEANRTGKQVYM